MPDGGSPLAGGFRVPQRRRNMKRKERIRRAMLMRDGDEGCFARLSSRCITVSAERRDPGGGGGREARHRRSVKESYCQHIAWLTTCSDTLDKERESGRDMAKRGDQDHLSKMCWACHEAFRNAKKGTAVSGSCDYISSKEKEKETEGTKDEEPSSFFLKRRNSAGVIRH